MEAEAAYGEALDAPATKAALWFGMLAGPAGWLLHLLVSYSLVLYVCTSGARWLLHLVTLAALALPAAGLWTAWRAWRRVGGADAPTARADAAGRTRFMAGSGLVLGAYFLLVVLFAEVPNLVFGACG